MLVFRLSQRALDFLLDGRFRFICDGECGATHYRRLGVSRVATVRGRQVDGDAAVIAEAFEVAALPFFWSELAIHPNSWVGATGCGCIR